MKKQLISFFKKETAIAFAIRRESLNNGREKLTPVVKQIGLLGNWTPIVKINGEYEALDIYNSFEYTEKDCVEFIDGYRDRIAKERGHLINKITYQEVI